MKLDILAFGAHPDDIELGCGGTMVKMKALGLRTGAADLTRGELGTRGTAEIRDREAVAAGKVMGVDVRENLRFRDGFIRNDEEHQLAVIRLIRAYRPEIVLANAPFDRHPDHKSGGDLVRDAAFMAGLRRVATELDGKPQEAWRPKKVFRYIQDYLHLPDFVVDITAEFERKMEAVRAYRSQFYDPESDEPETYISSKKFLENVNTRAAELGRMIGAGFGEGFIAEQPLRVENLLDLR